MRQVQAEVRRTLNSLAQQAVRWHGKNEHERILALVDEFATIARDIDAIGGPEILARYSGLWSDALLAGIEVALGLAPAN